MPRREPVAIITLASFVDEFISKRAISTKPSTRAVYGRVRKHLVEHFGEKMRLDEITAGDADDWVRYLQREKLAENTIRRHTGVAKQFFNDAIRRKLLTENPFKGLKQSVLANESRFHFVTIDDAEKVIDACPNGTWRLIVALARYGGLRTPSETFALKWCDIDWERQRMTVSSPKTEHHHGGDKRVVPIFPRLKSHLEAAFDAAEPGSVFVIPSMGDGRKNLRTRFERIIRRAGLTPWPKLFQNLRSTCETELCENFPLHVVTKWLGNSEQIAKQHYLQMTDEHFERATFPEAVQKVVQKAVQSEAIRTLPELAGDCPGKEKTPQNEGFCGVLMLADEACEMALMGGEGLEPPTFTV
ncbi:tyrosine-type recombinase/integrase [Planctopirus limnophila]|uniref:tyrosine-type recombinase/integrase n=1 Tax=Planctopirus limnophila TaxID=120 RepID=UPI0036F41D7D